MRKHILFIQLLTTFLLGIGLAQADEASTDIRWIMTGDSPSVDRSSTYLANGNIDQGIRYAMKALQRDLSATNELLATHNLCLAMILKGQQDEGQVYCDKVANMPSPQLAVKRVKEGLYKVSKRKSVTTMMFETLITNNLNLLNADMLISYAE
jgi:hypothetical protein